MGPYIQADKRNHIVVSGFPRINLVIILMAFDCLSTFQWWLGAGGPFVSRPWCFPLSLRVHYRLWSNKVKFNHFCPESVQKYWVWVSKEHEEVISAKLLPPRSPFKRLSEASRICTLPPWPFEQVRAEARGFNCLIRYFASVLAW